MKYFVKGELEKLKKLKEDEEDQEVYQQIVIEEINKFNEQQGLTES